jgi:hypothetical protein
MNSHPSTRPPRWAERLLEWLAADHLLEEVQGDLQELFEKRLQTYSLRKARLFYVLDLLKLIHPRLWRKKSSTTSLNPFDMITTYIKIALRHLAKNIGYSFLNMGGLAVGLAVAMLIGLWIWDELSFNKNYANYTQIARVLENQTYNGEIGTLWAAVPPVGNALRAQYGHDFKHVLMASHPQRTILSTGEKKLIKSGYYFEPGVTDMLSLHMLSGTRKGLQELHSILLSQSLAKAFFGGADPVGKVLKMDNNQAVTITGVYEDIPQNADFSNMLFIAPWSLYISSNSWIQQDAWWQNGFQAYVQLADHADIASISAKIRDLKKKAVTGEEAQAKPELFLFPMAKWHLYADFENGISTSGRIQFVWLYGMIGMFVILLACINFINLTTARASIRAKEVGIRKAIGSYRSQLIGQFLSESMVGVAFAFIGSLLLVQLLLPLFNDVAGKQLFMPWTHPGFWLIGIGFSMFTGLLAGSYPAFYLSAFKPVKALKGTFQPGRFAATPRKVLVVVQFTVSIILIIGTLVVFRQVRFAKDRPVGYDRNGLVMIETPTNEIHDHISAVRDELKKAGVIVELSESLNPMTGMSFSASGYDWGGNSSNPELSFGTVYIDHTFGKTVGWQFKEGRDFSRELATDSTGIVLNESAVRQMALQDPVGKTIRQTAYGNTEVYHVLGVIKDMLMESPYEPVTPTIYKINPGKGNFANIRIHPHISASEALGKIEAVFKKYSPSAPFAYTFIDEAYAIKFIEEERVGKLATLFACLAIFISCLGLFGLALFTAQQRIKEIGVRKVLGASVIDVWLLLSKDFVWLVLVALLIAMPVSYLLMSRWLENYTYRSSIGPWIFFLSGIGALLIAVCTVSYQAIKAALNNPVKSLRNE